MNWLRFTQEQTTGVLKEHQAGTGAAADFCRKHSLRNTTCNKRESKHGGIEVSDARRLTN